MKETSYPAKLNDTARLVSPLIPNDGKTRCLSFFFHMYGKEVNRLNVLRKFSNNETVVWTKKGNFGNLWLNGQIDTYSDSSSNFIFEGVVGLGFLVRI